MEPKFEQPKQYTPEEIAEMEKSRTISDAELLKGGAEYSINEKGEKENLLVTEEQKEYFSKEPERIEAKKIERKKAAASYAHRKETFYDVVLALEKKAYSLFVEKLGDSGGYPRCNNWRGRTIELTFSDGRTTKGTGPHFSSEGFEYDPTPNFRRLIDFDEGGMDYHLEDVTDIKVLK